MPQEEARQLVCGPYRYPHLLPDGSAMVAEDIAVWREFEVPEDPRESFAGGPLVRVSWASS